MPFFYAELEKLDHFTYSTACDRCINTDLEKTEPIL